MDEDYARKLRNWLSAEPEATPTEDDGEWRCPVIVLPVPRSSRENGCRMSEAEARSRWNHPTNWHRRQAQKEAEADAGRHRRDEPGSR
jgi:hypothetical protein